MVAPADVSEASNHVLSQIASDPTPTKLLARHDPASSLIPNVPLTLSPAPPQVPSMHVSTALRGGPCTDNSIVGGRAQGPLIRAVAQTADVLWLLLESGNRIKASRVNDVPQDKPLVRFMPPTPIPHVPSATPTPGTVCVVARPISAPQFVTQAEGSSQNLASAPFRPLRFCPDPSWQPEDEVKVEDTTKFSALFAGDTNMCGLCSVGTLRCLGMSCSGQMPVPVGQFSTAAVSLPNISGLRTHGKLQ